MGSSSGEGPSGTALENPPNSKEMLIFGLTAVFSMIFGIIFTLMTDWLPGVLISMGGSIILLLVIWNRQYRRRPKTARIQKDGILFTFRYGKKDRFVSWTSVYWLRAPPGDPDKIEGDWSQDGYMKSIDGTLFILYWQIAIATKEAYKGAIGKYPPEMYETG